jgi:hypothetical protein
MPPPTATAPVAAINDLETRRRLTPHAIAGFLAVAERWSLTVKDRQVLLGGLGRTTVVGWKKQLGASAAFQPLSIDRMTRISLLLGIHEGLGRLFRQTPAVADTWVTRANSDAPFHWRTPIRFMREGGLPAMATVCTYVNEWTGGGLVRESLRRSMT